MGNKMGNRVTSDTPSAPPVPITDGVWSHTDTVGYSQTRWYRNSVLHRDGEPAVIGYYRDGSYRCIEIYVQNGIVHRPVPPGANSYDYPSMQYYSLYFWHSPEGKLTRAWWVDAGVEGIVNNEQNVVVFPTEIFQFDKDGHIRTIKQPGLEYRCSQSWFLDVQFAQFESFYEEYERQRDQAITDYTNELELSSHMRAIFQGFVEAKSD
jgi:hypothetical protein